MPRQGSVHGSEKCICDLCECGNHKCPHNENHGRLIGSANSGPFGQTEYHNNYIHKNHERTQRAERLHTSLGQQGVLDTNTTHAADYKQWNTSERAHAIRPNDSYRGPTSPFNGETTHRMDFNEKKGDTVRAARPPTMNRRQSGPFDATTTNLHDYKVFEGNHRQRTSYRPNGSRHLSNEPFDGTTEHRANYDGKTIAVQRAARPITEYQPSSERMEGDTTYRIGFAHKKAEPAQSMKPSNERVGPDGPFDAMTTHRTDFIERQNGREKPCPAHVVLNQKTHNYQHVGQKDGHRFYRRVGLNSGASRELTRIIG
ncbi:hypothetical protein M3Y97_00361500 [Aphelenchoides bicaudatus]|nr:hypothetical protein M3Y97_00361500 [Aphelenchoides bicaudatus]